MSHHFDTEVAKEDSRLNILDVYIFEGSTSETTAMILTTNPDAGIFAPLTLHPEGLYAFRFDTNGDHVEEIAFKFLFDEPRHIGDDHSQHEQRFRVVVGAGSDILGSNGDVIVEGVVGEQAGGPSGVKAFVGRAAELWAADAFGFFTVVNAIFTEKRYATEAFEHRTNLFEGRNNMATVLEVPNAMFDADDVAAWATASLVGHAPEVQIYRWGLPLFTHLFLSAPERSGLAERFHTSAPSEDIEIFRPAVADMIATFSGLAGRTEDPRQYGHLLAERIVPAILPYRIGTAAQFDTERFNGRPLHSDAFDVMLSLGANTAITDGVAPDVVRIRKDFPYCALPYSAADQHGMRPLRELIGLTY
jgi:hypothetical protein